MSRSGVCLVLLILLSLFFITGCFVVDTWKFLTPEGPPSYDNLWQDYNSVEIDLTNAAETLEIVYRSEFELLSQSRSVIASVGQKKKGYKSWFKLVAFDEDSLTAQRKYFFVVDEKPKQLFVSPWAYVRYDCEFAVDQSLSEEPYADDNARLIALLRWVLTKTRSDIDEVAADNKVLAVDGMMISQALNAVLVMLDNSPAHAEKLLEQEGLLFTHISLNKGKIRLREQDNRVFIRIVIGSNTKQFKLSFEKFEDTNEPPLR